jgi:hypothetical protein
MKPPSLRRLRPRLPARLVAVSWRDLLGIGLPVLAIAVLAAWLAVKFVRPAPPDTIYLVGGPEGSSYRTNAQKYQKIIGRNGVKVVIVDSQGSLDNLRLLADRNFRADAAFVQGGLAEGVDTSGLVSLGSVFVQPLTIFYRGAEPLQRVAQLRGRRIAIGGEGSGTRSLALRLLKASEADGPPTRLLDLGGEEAAQALKQGKVDVVFLMGDSATPRVIVDLVKTRGIRLMSLAQAESYVRRFRFLSELTLPEGAADLARNIPPGTVNMVGPTVELVARDTLHPALSDLLIAAAREVHGPAGMFRKAGEFPAPQERDFPISADAQRYYKSGTPFLYSRLPFWLASLTDRLLVILVPLAVVIVPLTRIVPPIYRWRVRSRIYRWYGKLISLERDMLMHPEPGERARILGRLDEIENAVNDIRTPLSFADQLYVLRQHIGWVRQRLMEGNPEAGTNGRVLRTEN